MADQFWGQGMVRAVVKGPWSLHEDFPCLVPAG